MDRQHTQVDAASTVAAAEDPGVLRPDASQVGEALSLLGRATRPLVLASGGIRASRAVEPFRRLVDRLGIPVVHSLMGVDVLPYSHPLRVGMIGTYGNRWANTALGNSDCVLVLGSRLDVHQTGSDTDAFRLGRDIIHVDCEAGEINNRITGCQSIVATLPEFMEVANRDAQSRDISERAAWREQIDAWRLQWPDTAELAPTRGLNPNVFLHHLSKASRLAAAYVVDVGQHQMWAAQSLEIEDGQRFLTSGGLGSMGFALPASIGAAVAANSPVVVVAGDGGISGHQPDAH